MLNTKQLRAMRQTGEFDTVNTYRMPWKALSFIGGLTIILIMTIFMSRCANAATVPYNDKNAILAIIGEGENQGYTGMLALAGAIRNRGTLKGVYGIKAPRVKAHKYSHGTYLQAKKAWEASATVDITHGADHWENIKAFGKPYWANSMIETFRHKDHVFYMAKGE